MKIRTALSLIVLLLNATFCLCGQSAAEIGLVLDGSTVLHPDSERDMEPVRHRLRMVFRNTGSEPVIIINPTLGYGTGLREIVFYNGAWNAATQLRAADVEFSRKSMEPDNTA